MSKALPLNLELNALERLLAYPPGTRLSFNYLPAVLINWESNMISIRFRISGKKGIRTPRFKVAHIWDKRLRVIT